MVDASLRLITEKGPQGFTLSEAAKATGVTPAAVYRHFAGRYPGHYMAMFESSLSVNATPDLAVSAARAGRVLEEAAAKLSEHIPPDKRPPAAMFSAHIWAMSHGLVELFARDAPGARSTFPPEEILETGIGIYLRGLGLLPPDA